VDVGSRKLLAPEAQKSLRTWANQEVAKTEGSKALKALKIRPESWKVLSVADGPALSVVGDFEEGNEKKVGYSVFTLGTSNAAAFTLYAPAKDFEAFQPQFDAIVNSYKEK